MGGNLQRSKTEGVGKQLIIEIKDSLWYGSWYGWRCGKKRKKEGIRKKGRGEGKNKVLQELTRDDHSDTVFSRLKVFISASWDHSQVLQAGAGCRWH